MINVTSKDSVLQLCMVSRDQISLLCFYFYLLCYAAVLINFTYYAQYYAHVRDLCLGIWTVLLWYIHLKYLYGDCSIRVYRLISIMNT